MRNASSFCAALLIAVALALTTQPASASKTTSGFSASNKPQGLDTQFSLPDIPRTYGELTAEDRAHFKPATVQSTTAKNGASVIRSEMRSPKNRRMLAQSSNQLQYYGGPVMVDTVNVYMIYVMNKDATGASDAWKWTEWPDYLVSNLAGSSRWDINTLFYDSLGNYVNGNIVLAQSTYIGIPTGWPLTGSADVLSLVDFAINKGLLPVDNDNGIYVVAVAPNTGADMDPKYCSDSAKDSFCAYHTVGNTDNNGELKFAFVPMSGGLECPTSCAVAADWYIGAASPLYNPHFDRFLSSIVHELEETVTDPFLNVDPGWQTADGRENGDLCSGDYGEVFTTTNNQGITVAYNSIIGQAPLMLQTGWSIDTSECVNQL